MNVDRKLLALLRRGVGGPSILLQRDVSMINESSTLAVFTVSVASCNCNIFLGI